MATDRMLPQGMLEALAGTDAYPDDPTAARGVERLQTHVSHLFLTRERVYKLRKPVQLPFVSFETLEERNADCLREVALNRRLAPDVYLGVAAVRRDAGGAWRVGKAQEELAPGGEHCVVMRRLPKNRDALSKLERNKLSHDDVAAIAETIAEFHDANGLGVPAPFEPEEWRERARRAFVDSIELARGAGCAALDPSQLDALEVDAEARLAACAERLEARRLAGLAIDGHGDLHLQHPWFEAGRPRPVVIDCIEFRADWRRGDAASEVAFLAMDLRYRGRRDLAEHFLATYAQARDDYDLYGVVDWYIAYRATVRGAVAAVASADSALPRAQREAAEGSAVAHIELARVALRPGPAGEVVALCGGVGSGKSTAADTAAWALECLVISSDRTRKRMAGVAPTERVEGERRAELYSEATTRAVYEGLIERADRVARSGRSVVLDATFSKRWQRDLLGNWARERGLRLLLLHVHCGEAETLLRLERRAREGRDPSDAGPELYARSAREFEPPTEWPAAALLEVDTGAERWDRSFTGRVRAWSRSDRLTPRR